MRIPPIASPDLVQFSEISSWLSLVTDGKSAGHTVCGDDESTFHVNTTAGPTLLAASTAHSRTTRSSPSTDAMTALPTVLLLATIAWTVDEPVTRGQRTNVG